ncbi:SDR family NAD(P)-dependent oxidoreductase [Ferrimonas pelagia]|uniref:SDR family NAD(P)-dependent oxidoreductase n=1 Tax=Ferrimonas pelagia TaxID=1177826 RepID=A0ABP9FC62_9GAMM
MKEFNQKVAVITGAGGGIGRELSLQLARQGCDLALADISEENVTETQRQAQQLGVKASIHLVDVGDAEAYQAFVAEVIDSHGKVNLLFNNAGITLQRSFENHSIEDWDLVLRVNLWGVIHGCKFFLPHLKAADEAHIVNLSSMAGFLGLPNQASYSSTKAAVRMLSETLATELARFNIGVTSVHPGAIATNMIRNTLDRADDQAKAKKTLETVEKMAMPVEKAASTILTAVNNKSFRVRIGKDSVLLDLLKRWMPVMLHKLIIHKMSGAKRAVAQS